MKYIVRTAMILLLIAVQFSTVVAQVKKVDVIGITVGDMNTSVKFYTEVLGFRKISDRETSGKVYEDLYGLFGLRIRVVQMQLGDEKIELTDYITVGGRSIPENTSSNDLSFQHIAIVVSDMDKAYTILKNHHVQHISTAPQTIPKSNVAAAGIKAFYFQDPDKHSLELIYFPKGKGQDKWQQNNGKIFLGIDHTAIAVSNTENSLAFYQKLLGIERKGESFNQGTEQEHLNNVEGASLHITGLRVSEGPGVEFLQYLQPGPGKKYPADTRSDDLWNWQTTVLVNDADELYEKCKAMNMHFVSKQIVECKGDNSTPVKAFVVRDPDGHAVLIKGSANTKDLSASN